MKRILTIICIIFINHFAFAQIDKNSDLYKTIISKDSLLFNVGFNTCDIAQFENLLSDNFIFFHDKDGISDKTKFLSDLKNGICNSQTNRQVQRFLIKESTNIFSLYKNGVLYGAVQNGEHKFSEKRETQAGIAKFTNVWQLENGEWKLITSFSFDHQPYENKKTEQPIFGNDILIEKWLKENNIPTLGIGIINNGKLQQVKVFGELQKGISAPYNTVFNVASLAKPVTAIVALKLVSSGKWNLDELLYKYWTDPDVAKDENHKILSTRHILSHQSGFANWRWENQDGKLRFEFIPGTQYQYSGEGFEYLRKALEKKFSKSLNQLASELIFEPLKMTDTQYIWNENSYNTRFATGYNTEGKPYKTIKNKTANAADDLLTTIEDYGNFLVSVLNCENLSEEIFKEMTMPRVLVKKDKYFGLGFLIYDLGNGEYAISHGGGDEGSQTIAVLFPETKQGIVIFTNVDDGYKVYEKLLTHYFGDKGKRIVEIETE